ncbi:MAG: phospholipase D-like domain-containing protein [Candidatus Micrarchaeota archaeon]
MAKTKYALFFFLGVAVTTFSLYAFGGLQPKSQAICLDESVQALISPPVADEMVAAIDSAQYTIDIMLYQFSYSGLKTALANAEERGVRVRIILEPRVDSNFPTAEFLDSKGVEVKWASKKFANTHAKVAIVDGKRIIVGSINWSQHAMFQNREIGVLIESEELANQLLQVFEADWDIASEYASGESALNESATED